MVQHTSLRSFLLTTLLALLTLLTLPLNVSAKSLNDMGTAAANVTMRDDKLIFMLVKWANVRCGSGLDVGTCVTDAECRARGGQAVGGCAKGYGVCCRVLLSGCGGVITQNNTLVTSPRYPSTYNAQATCLYRVRFDSETICHVRYDHVDNQLAPPDLYGKCNNDQLVFKDDTKSTYFCGRAPDNYHWLVDTAGTSSPHIFTVTSDASSYERRYAILVSLLPCTIRIPAKCGMYLTGTEGRITSYNFGHGYYLAGLSYSVCWRREAGYCRYSLSATSDRTHIRLPDLLRLPMGQPKSLRPNPNHRTPQIFINFCSKSFFDWMYSSVAACLYPDVMQSYQTKAPFYISLHTYIDTTANTNPLFTSPIRSGYQLDWAHDLC